MHRLAVGLVSAALAIGVLAVPASAAGVTRWVDDDGRAGPRGCNGAASASTTIQAAINASRRDDTVLVCPGIYRERLRIGPAKRGLTIRSVRPWVAKVHRPAAVGGDDVDLVRVIADDVTLQHLVFVTRVRRTLLQGAPSCLRSLVRVTGQEAVIRANRMRATGDTGRNCAYRVGVLVGGPGLDGRSVTGALVTHNLIRDFWDAGVGVRGGGGGQVDATVARNSIRYWHLTTRFDTSSLAAGPAGFFPLAAGIQFDRAGGAIMGNAITSGPDARSPVTAGAATPLLSNGIDVELSVVDMRRNTIRRATRGIRLWEVNDSKVIRNLVSQHDEGILIDLSDRNVVRGNQVGPGAYGIRVPTWAISGINLQSVDNRIVGNTSTGHTVADCYDGSSGGGTAGTANRWRNNTGSESFPAGICRAD